MDALCRELREQPRPEYRVKTLAPCWDGGGGDAENYLLQIEIERPGAISGTGIPAIERGACLERLCPVPV
ncbi:hypothetical protein PR048_030499 [Dryococelus australis]|uniref:Uncharacterized protein n=1 Tax=Dryococelus australis TaxID=614101 RepID=A0ABQ9G958_9NEOP|nr:hypothetical protein PR048_030499 [Dryococelus australis]